MSEPRDRRSLGQRDHDYLWHPFTPQDAWLAQDPLVIARGEGVYLFDVDGNRYLDGVSSLWCNVHGHRHPTLDQALRRQLDDLAHSTMLGLTHPAAIELAQKLVEIAPPGLRRVFYSDNGATAVEVALKMAFQFWRQKTNPEPSRTRFLALSNAYHGDTLGDVSLGGVSRFHDMFQPLLFEVLRAPSPHCYRCPLGLERSSCEIACLAEVDHLLSAHEGEVAAVVVEPLVQCAAGMIVHPQGYLKGLHDLARKHDTLLITDEVAVGFGRTGRMFACEWEGVTPDFLCLAKGITGGYLPLAATLTTDRVYEAFVGDAQNPRTFFHGHTYGGNPLGAAVALASLQVFDDESTLAQLVPRSATLARRLGDMARLPHVGSVRHRGLIGAIELVASKPTKEPYPPDQAVGAEICRRARSRGLLIRPLGDVLVIMPPLSITEAELEQILDIIETLILEVTQEVKS